MIKIWAAQNKQISNGNKYKKEMFNHCQLGKFILQKRDFYFAPSKRVVTFI